MLTLTENEINDKLGTKVLLDIDILCGEHGVCACVVRTINWFTVEFAHKIRYGVMPKNQKQNATTIHQSKSNSVVEHQVENHPLTLCCASKKPFKHILHFRVNDVTGTYMKMAYVLKWFVQFSSVARRFVEFPCNQSIWCWVFQCIRINLRVSSTWYFQKHDERHKNEMCHYEKSLVMMIKSRHLLVLTTR